MFFEYERLLLDTGNQLIHYSPKYLRFLAELLEQAELNILEVRREGRLVGILPVMSRDSVEFGPVLNSCPFFGSHGGPVASDAETEFLLIQNLLEFAEAQRACSLTVVENPISPISDKNLFALGLEPTDVRTGQMTYLPVDLEEIHPKTRAAIRQAGLHSPRYLLSVASGDWDWVQMEHERSIEALGGVSKGKRVFELLRKCLGDDCQLWMATVGDTNAAALVTLTYGNTVEYFTPVVSPEFRSRQILSGLIWFVMSSFALEGFRVWNWGGTWPTQDGVYRFKSRWNAVDQQYRYFTTVFRPEILGKEPRELRQLFPYFYVYPFGRGAN